MKTSKRNSGDRRDQGAAIGVDGMQPGACASAVGEGTSHQQGASGKRKEKRDASAKARSVQPAGAGARKNPTLVTRPCDVAGVAMVGTGSVSGEETGSSILPAAESVSEEVAVRRADGERCDCEGLTPGGRMIPVGTTGRLVFMTESRVVRYLQWVREISHDALRWRAWSRSAKGVRAFKDRRTAWNRIDEGKKLRATLDDLTENALGEFLLTEKGGLA
jgi:hypothetical protein